MEQPQPATVQDLKALVEQLYAQVATLSESDRASVIALFNHTVCKRAGMCTRCWLRHAADHFECAGRAKEWN